MNTMDTTHEILFFGSFPGDDNDDCHQGYIFVNHESCMAAWIALLEGDQGDLSLAVREGVDTTEHPDAFAARMIAESGKDHVVWVALRSGDVHQDFRLRPDQKPSENEDDSEFAMMQGMAFGIDAYNEARGCEFFRDDM